MGIEKDYSDDIDLRMVFRILWQGKVWILSITLIFALAGTVTSLLIPNRYTADILLAPVIQEQGLGAKLNAQLGGLATLAGIRGKQAAADKGALALEVLNSRVFINDFVARHDIAVQLMAGKGWDQESNTWIIDEKKYDTARQRWLRKGKPAKGPTPGKIYSAFTKSLAVNEDKKSGMVRISFESYSPEAAQRWTNWIVHDLNDYMRTQDIADAKRSINYLSQQIEKTASKELHQVFYQLIEEQSKTMMLGEITEQYVFKIIDPAAYPEKKSKPKRAIIAAGSLCVGALLGIALVLIRHSVSKNVSI